VTQYGISWADALTVAGAAGVHSLGAGIPLNVTLGRCDNPVVNPQVCSVV
jgi:hypothetical protein